MEIDATPKESIMPNEGVTVAQFLLGTARDHVKRAETAEPLNEAREELGRLAGSIPWSTVRLAVEDKLHEALSFRLDDLLISTWIRSAMLAKYLDPSRYPPDQTVVAHLAEHTVKTTQRPSIAILVDNHPVKTIPMEVSVSLLVKGAILTIQNGAVVRLETGTCQAAGKVMLAGVTLAEKKLAPVALPGQLRFAKGKGLEPNAP